MEDDGGDDWIETDFFFSPANNHFDMNEMGKLATKYQHIKQVCSYFSFFFVCYPLSLSLFLFFILYSLFFILYSLFFIFYSLFFILYSLFFILYSLFFILYSLFFILYSLFFILYSFFFLLHSLFFILYSLFFILYSLFFSNISHFLFSTTPSLTFPPQKAFPDESGHLNHQGLFSYFSKKGMSDRLAKGYSGCFVENNGEIVFESFVVGVARAVKASQIMR